MSWLSDIFDLVNAARGYDSGSSYNHDHFRLTDTTGGQKHNGGHDARTNTGRDRTIAQQAADSKRTGRPRKS